MGILNTQDELSKATLSPSRRPSPSAATATAVATTTPSTPEQHQELEEPDSGYVSSPAESSGGEEEVGEEEEEEGDKGTSAAAAGDAAEGGACNKVEGGTQSQQLVNGESSLQVDGRCSADQKGGGGEEEEEGGGGGPTETVARHPFHGSLVESSLGDVSAVSMLGNEGASFEHGRGNHFNNVSNISNVSNSDVPLPMPLSSFSVAGGGGGSCAENLPRPAEEYRQSLVKLQSAALEAQRLYSELMSSAQHQSQRLIDHPRDGASSSSSSSPHSIIPQNIYSSLDGPSSSSSSSSSVASNGTSQASFFNPPPVLGQLLEDFEATWRGLGHLSSSAQQQQQQQQQHQNQQQSGSVSSSVVGSSMLNESSGGWAAMAMVGASGGGGGGGGRVGGTSASSSSIALRSSAASDSFVSASFASLGATGGLWHLNHHHDQQQERDRQQQQQQPPSPSHEAGAYSSGNGLGVADTLKELPQHVSNADPDPAAVAMALAAVGGLAPILERGESDVNTDAPRAFSAAGSGSSGGSEASRLVSGQRSPSALAVAIEEGNADDDCLRTLPTDGGLGDNHRASTPPSRPAPPPPPATPPLKASSSPQDPSSTTSSSSSSSANHLPGLARILSSANRQPVPSSHSSPTFDGSFVDSSSDTSHHQHQQQQQQQQQHQHQQQQQQQQHAQHSSDISSRAASLRTSDVSALSAGGSFSGMAAENEDVSHILEKYSDVLLSMVQQKLLASSSPSSPLTMVDPLGQPNQHELDSNRAATEGI